jgi:hypothetical protein
LASDWTAAESNFFFNAVFVGFFSGAQGSGPTSAGGTISLTSLAHPAS